VLKKQHRLPPNQAQNRHPPADHPPMESIVLSEASSLVANHILVDAEEEEEREAEGGPEEEDM